MIEKVGLADQAQPAAPAKIELSCLAGRDLRSELRGGGGMTVLRDACAAELAVAVDDWNLGPIERDAILATFVAYHVAPYGPSVAVTSTSS